MKEHLYQMLQVVTGTQAGHAHHRKIPPAFIEITCPHYILVIQFPRALMDSYANIHELQKDLAF